MEPRVLDGDGRVRREGGEGAEVGPGEGSLLEPVVEVEGAADAGGSRARERDAGDRSEALVADRALARELGYALAPFSSDPAAWSGEFTLRSGNRVAAPKSSSAGSDKRSSR